jgi:hypothetical protein
LAEQPSDVPFPLPACGECTGIETTEGVVSVTLTKACAVHGGLTRWLAASADSQVAEKATRSAEMHERAAQVWAEVTDSVASFVEGLAEKLRRDR